VELVADAEEIIAAMNHAPLTDNPFEAGQFVFAQTRRKTERPEAAKRTVRIHLPWRFAYARIRWRQ
jgi:hypothetical protein